MSVAPGDSISALALAGDLDLAGAALDEALASAGLEPCDRLGLARVAIEIGRADAALAELTRLSEGAQAEVGADVRADALAELAALRADLGLDRPVAPPPADLPPSWPDPVPALLEAGDGDLVRFLHLFVGREDVHARQWWDERKQQGGYAPVRQALTPSLLRAHLSGSATLGTYVVRIDGTVTSLAVDLDLPKPALAAAAGNAAAQSALRQRIEEARLAASAELTHLGLPHVTEDSGYKGRHLWAFLERPMLAERVHAFGQRLGQRLRRRCPGVGIEIFPKQGKLTGEGLGNLIKLPLGIHLRTGRRALLLDDAGRPVADPWPLLRSAPRVTEAALLAAWDALRESPSEAPAETTAETTGETTALIPTPVPRRGPRFTREDLRTRADLAPVLADCSVLSAIVDDALARRTLSHDAQIVLSHSLGHLPSGVEAVNYVLKHCPDVPDRAHLVRRLRGHPISCPKIRQRLPGVTSRLPCYCELQGTTTTYPNPLLHGQEQEAP